MAPRKPTARRRPPRPRAPPARPAGFSTVTPYLAVRGAVRAIEFYAAAFGAKELQRETTPDGKILHSRLRIGDSIVMLADEFEGGSMTAPEQATTSPITLHLYVPDVDAVWKRALAAGARVVHPLDDMFWGERYGQLRDPFGHLWSVSTPLRMSRAEREAKRAEAMRSFAPADPPSPDAGG